MKPVIRTLWIGGSLSRLEKICLASFLYHGHRVVLYVYDKVDNLPRGVEVADASEIVPKDKIFTYGKITGQGKGSYAGFANYFRYKMLLIHPNSFWVDADVICLKPFLLEDELVFCYESQTTINNAVIGSKNKGHKLFYELIEYCENPFKIKKWDTIKIMMKKLYGRFWGKCKTEFIPWGLTGPKALSGYVFKLNLEKYSVASPFYYPILPSNWKDIFLDENINISDLGDAYSIHLWNEYLRRDGIDKNQKMNPNSLYEKIISEYKLDSY
ncbi:TPA: hypothetical protein ACX6NR_000468 [Photobacterium damselae]